MNLAKKLLEVGAGRRGYRLLESQKHKGFCWSVGPPSPFSRWGVEHRKAKWPAPKHTAS